MTVNKLIAYSVVFGLGALGIYGWVDSLPPETKRLLVYTSCGIPTTVVLYAIHRSIRKLSRR